VSENFVTIASFLELVEKYSASGKNVPAPMSCVPDMMPKTLVVANVKGPPHNSGNPLFRQPVKLEFSKKKEITYTFYFHKNV